MLWTVLLSVAYRGQQQYICFPLPVSKNAGLFILTSDNDECSFLNTLLSSSFLFYSHLFFVFVFELLRFDECYAINLPYFIIWQVDNTLWQLWVGKPEEWRERSLIDSTSILLSNTNFICHVSLYMTSVPIKLNFD